MNYSLLLTKPVLVQMAAGILFKQLKYSLPSKVFHNEQWLPLIQWGKLLNAKSMCDLKTNTVESSAQDCGILGNRTRFAYSQNPLTNTDILQNELNNVTSPLIKLLREIESCQSQDAEILNNVMCHLKSDLNAASYDEFLVTILLIANTYGHKSKEPFVKTISTNYFEILEKEYSRRRKALSIEQNLTILDALAKYQHYKKSHVVKKILYGYCANLKKLNMDHAIHVLKLVHRFGKLFIKEDKFKFQTNLESMISNMNALELQVLAGTLSRVQFKCNAMLTQKLCDKVLAEIENMDSKIMFTVSLCILKCMSRQQTKKTLLNFQEKMMVYNEKFDMSSLTELVSIGMYDSWVHSSSFQVVLDRAKKNINDCGLFVLERLLHLSTLFAIKDDEFLKLAVNNFLQQDLHFSFTPSIVRNLMELGVFEMNSIKSVMSETFTDIVFNALHYAPVANIIAIDNTLEIEVPNYDGPKLSNLKKKKGHMKLKGAEYNEESKLHWNLKMAHKLYSICESNYGKNMVTTKRILPARMTLAVVRFNRNLEPQPIPKEYDEIKMGIIYPIPDEHFWIPMVFVRTIDLGDSSEISKTHINFVTSNLVRQLKIIGYTPVLVPVNIWLRNIQHCIADKYIDDEIKTQLKKLSNVN